MGNCLPCRRGKDQKAQTELNHLSLLQTSSSGKDDASSEPEKSVSVENVQLTYEAPEPPVDEEPIVIEQVTQSMIELVGSVNKKDQRVISVISKADAYAKELSENDWTLQSLSDYIVLGVDEEYSKFERDLFCVRCVVIWIYQNIEYDFDGYLAGDYKKKNIFAANVLSDKKTIHTGFVTLLINLLDRMEIECKDIRGWVNDIVDEIPESTDAFEPNHEWNAVKIDDRWFFVDVLFCIGSRKVNPITKSGLFVKEFNEGFFLSKPDYLIFSHFPEESEWQLKEPVVTWKEFINNPRFLPSYFELGILVDKEFACYNISAEEHLTIPFRISSQTWDRKFNIVVDFHSVDAGTESILTKYNLSSCNRVPLNQCLEVACSFPKSGIYLLDILAGTQDDIGGFTLTKIVSYRVNCTKGLPLDEIPETDYCIGYPKKFIAFHHTNDAIVEPRQGIFPINVPVTFKIWSRNSISMILVHGKDWYEMTRSVSDDENSGSLFELTLKSMQNAEAKIYSKRESQEYEPIIEYCLPIAEVCPVKISPNSFKLGVEIEQLEYGPHGAILTAKLPSTVMIASSLVIEEKGEVIMAGPDGIFEYRSGDQMTFFISLPTKGLYIFDCIARIESTKFMPIFSVQFPSADEAPENHFCCVPVKVEFNDRFDRLESPVFLQSPCSGVPQTFVIASNNAQRLVIVNNGNWYDFEKDQGLLSATIPLEPDHIVIYVLREGVEEFKEMLTYLYHKKLPST